MKKTITLFAVILSVVLFSCNQSSNDKKDKKDASQIFNLDTTKLNKGDVFYHCPMDLEVISDKAGYCPKCEMELTAIKKQ